MARSKAEAPPFIDIDKDALEQVLKVCEAKLPAETYAVVKAAIDSLARLQQLVRRRGTTIAYLRGLLGFTSSEKTADVLKAQAPASAASGGAAGQAEGGEPAQSDVNAAASGASAPSASPTPAPTPPAPAPSSAVGGSAGNESPARAGTNKGDSSPAEKKPGHGRVPASAYSKAEHIAVLHQTLRPGDVCPTCECGKVYDLKDPAPLLRIFGQAPLIGLCWDCQQLRCATCGHVYTAQAPKAAQGPKHDESAAAMLGVLIYGCGLPMHRLEKLQRAFDTPVPASTQWDVVNASADDLLPAYSEMFRRAAQGVVLHNDDTFNRVLELMGKRRAALLKAGELDDPDRTGLFTTAIVSIGEDRRPITLYFTGRQHAGENLADVLKQRAAELPVPTLMSDALARNVPAGHAVDEANCIPHGRRKVVREVDNFPAECRLLLEKLSVIFKVDKRCRLEGLTDQERLETHQRESAPVMQELRAWMTAQIEEKRIEPNSGLGKAFSYMLKRWEKFTLFLRKPGAPLDNNICERALKKAILHRKNSLFYRSLRGALVGDIFMTLIHTAELHGENPFEYLTALLCHSKAVAERPGDWMPWNYREVLARLEGGRLQAPARSIVAVDIVPDPVLDQRAPAPVPVSPGQDRTAPSPAEPRTQPGATDADASSRLPRRAAPTPVPARPPPPLSPRTRHEDRVQFRRAASDTGPPKPQIAY